MWCIGAFILLALVASSWFILVSINSSRISQVEDGYNE
jgi:hypothetical protein